MSKWGKNKFKLRCPLCGSSQVGEASKTRSGAVSRFTCRKCGMGMKFNLSLRRSRHLV